MGACITGGMKVVSQKKEVPNEFSQKVSSIEFQTVIVDSSDSKEEEGPTRRCYESLKGENICDLYGNKYPSLFEWFVHTAEKYSDRNAMAYRKIEKEEKGEIEEAGKKKPWTFLHLSEAKYFTFSEIYQQILKVGSGLAKLGLTGQETRIGIYEETRYEWLVSLYGMWSQSVVGVTVYSNLGEDALEYAIREAELTAIFCAGKSVKNVCKLKELTSLKYLIVYDAVPEGTLIPEGIQVVTFEDLLKSEPIQPVLPKPTDTSLIMYTSGTTGDPKGVVMTHKNMVSGVEVLNNRSFDALGIAEPDEVYLAYLPLAHILELISENVYLSRGSCICYGNPRTLTDTSARPHGDLKEFKPTIIVGVPRVFDTIKKGIEAKLPPVGSLKRKIINQAFNDRVHALSRGYDTPYYNKSVFQSFKSILGGKVKILFSGGAPLSANTYEWLAVMFCCSIGQGYGLTESCGIASVQRYFEYQPDNVGSLCEGVEMKLRDVGDWTSSKGDPQQGEICIRGPCVSQGYFKQPEKTAEVFLPDGFFTTGDVGEWQKDGTLKIIGRVKALAKNTLGEYIAMEALEAVYTSCDLIVPNGICIIVDPQAAYIGAIILTDEKKATEFMARYNLEGTFPEILKTKEFEAKVVLALEEIAKAAKRRPFEFLKQVRVFADEWTPENGIVTAAMKLKRREIDCKYASDIKAMFV